MTTENKDAGSPILIVEPHPDDALLSCSHVLASNADKLVLSIGVNDSDGSAKLADYYPHIRTIDLRLPNIGWGFRCTPKEVKNTSDPVHYVRERLHEYPEYMARYGEVYAALTPYKSQPNVFVPVGLIHPYHVLVREVADEVFQRQQVTYYADKPYSEMGYGKLIEKGYDMGSSVSSPSGPRKLAVFKAVYPKEHRRMYRDLAKIETDERLYGSSLRTRRPKLPTAR